MNSRTDSRRSSSRRLIYGFGITLTLLLVVALYALFRLWQIDDEVTTIVDVNAVKNEMLNEMSDAIRQRQYRLREMIIFTDEFEREDSWLAYTLAADRFLKARNAYSAYPRLIEEEEAYSKLNELANKGVFLERKMVDMLRSGKGIQKVSREAFDSQDASFAILDKLVSINKVHAEKALAQAQSNSQFSIFTLSILMCLGLVAGIGVSFNVVVRDRDMLDRLHAQRDELENMKDTASEELASYSYALAHDLTAPLRAVTGFSQILIQDASSRLKEEELSILKRVANAGLVMSQIIEDMLRLSRITRASVNFEKVNLSELAEKLNQHYRYKYPEEVPDWKIAKGLMACVDINMARDLLEQLFSNAFRFSRQQEFVQIEFGVKIENDRKIFYVADNGMGFDPKYRSLVFTPFKRLNTLVDDSGTGIGLALAYRIVRRHQGRIWIETDINEGTTVFFMFPKLEC